MGRLRGEELRNSFSWVSEYQIGILLHGHFLRCTIQLRSILVFGNDFDMQSRRLIGSLRAHVSSCNVIMIYHKCLLNFCDLH